MNCPQCGSEGKENEKFCQNCGAPLASPAPAAPPAAAVQSGEKLSFKNFLKSEHCTPDVNKSITTSWILLFIVSALSLGAAAMQGLPIFDGILMAAVALWLLLSKSLPAAVTACVVGVAEMILTSMIMGKFAGYLPALAGIFALTAVLKGRRQYKAYLHNDAQQ